VFINFVTGKAFKQTSFFYNVHLKWRNKKLLNRLDMTQIVGITEGTYTNSLTTMDG